LNVAGFIALKKKTNVFIRKVAKSDGDLFQMKR